MVFRCRSKTQSTLSICASFGYSGKQSGCLASNLAVWQAIRLSGKQSSCLGVWQAIRLFGKPQVEGTWPGEGKMSFGGGPKQQSSWLQDTRSACCLGHTGAANMLLGRSSRMAGWPACGETTRAEVTWSGRGKRTLLGLGGGLHWGGTINILAG